MLVPSNRLYGACNGISAAPGPAGGGRPLAGLRPPRPPVDPGGPRAGTGEGRPVRRPRRRRARGLRAAGPPRARGPAAVERAGRVGALRPVHGQPAGRRARPGRARRAPARPRGRPRHAAGADPRGPAGLRGQPRPPQPRDQRHDRPLGRGRPRPPRRAPRAVRRRSRGPPRPRSHPLPAIARAPWAGDLMSTPAAPAAPPAAAASTAGPGSTGLPPRQILAILSGLMLGMFLAALDQNIVATSIRTIADDLNGLNLQAWATTAYLLTATISTPPYGKLSDLYGRKPFFLSAIGIFVVGSVLCTIATSMYELAAYRAIQGLGAGGLMSLALTIIGDIVPPRERARYQGFFLAVFGTSSVLGPVIGGFLAGQ